MEHLITWHHMSRQIGYMECQAEMHQKDMEKSREIFQLQAKLADAERRIKELRTGK